MDERSERLMSEQEVADYCHVHIATVRKWRRTGTGPPVRWAGNKPRYRRSEVDAWLDRPPSEREGDGHAPGAAGGCTTPKS